MSATATAQTESASRLPSLFADSAQLQLTEPLRMTSSPRNQTATYSQLAAQPADQWAIWQPNTALPTSPAQDVWLRMVMPATASPQTWMLRIPRFALEKATLYEQPTSGGVTDPLPSAGQAIAPQDWPMRSRDPVFELSTRKDQTQLFFIRVQNRVPVTENIQLIRSADFADGANRVGTLNGLIIGIFAFLTLVSLVSAKINRSYHFAWFALYTFSVMMAQLAVSGYLMLRVWPGSVYLSKTMIWVIPFLSLAAMARFSLSISYAKELSRTIYFALWALIFGCLLMCLGVLFITESFPRILLNAGFGLGMLVVITSLAWIAWRSQYWLWWVVASLLPVMLSAAARLAHNIGWVAHVELALLAGVITASFGLLFIYAVMVMNQRDKSLMVQRQDVLESNDAATGLYNERIALARLPQIILRSKRFAKPCGAIMVRWLDFNMVMSHLSSTERTRVFSHFGNRLGRLARDIDTVARVGDDKFIFLVEAPVSREQLTSLASHMLTTCMRPSTAMPDQKGFDVNMAVWLSNDVVADAKQVMELLKTRIDQMREGTQRRVQFIDSPLTTSSSSDLPQAEMAQALVQKINELEATQGLPQIALKSRPPPT